MKRLEVGKLYCVREIPLIVFNSPIESLMDLNKRLGYIDTSQPFLIISVKGTWIQVVFEDKTGWIVANQPMEEISCA
jgi:hypothetical protein